VEAAATFKKLNGATAIPAMIFINDRLSIFYSSSSSGKSEHR
jgi:hypothetical protein